jgi:hypothetical protein
MEFGVNMRRLSPELEGSQSRAYFALIPNADEEIL